MTSTPLQAATDEPSTRYTTIAIRDTPYPNGLGKLEYEALEDGMRRLLGVRYESQEANAEIFWTPRYQQLIADHLRPHFAPKGDIVSIARSAAESARASVAFDRIIPADGYAAYVRYIDGLPAWSDHHVSSASREAARWARHPPTLFADSGSLLIDDGRHRLSLLRSLVEPVAPDFRVLVRVVGPRSGGISGG